MNSDSKSQSTGISIPNQSLDDKEFEKERKNKSRINIKDRALARSKLKNFYALDDESKINGTQLTEETKKNESTPLTETDKLNITSFDFEVYVKKMLEEKNIPGLLIQCNTLDSEVKKLESDLKTLVYENYNKFIQATETLGEMKICSESMEKKMELLSNKIENICVSSNDFENIISTERKKIQELDEELELTKKKKSITDLPEKLYSSVICGNYKMAVDLWKNTIPLLNKTNTVSINDEMRASIENTISEVEEILWSKWKDPDTPIDDIMDCSWLLIQIAPDKIGNLWKEYIEIQDEKLRKLRDLWPESNNNIQYINEYNIKYLSNWENTLTGFLNMFIPPEQSGLVEQETLNTKKNYQKTPNTALNEAILSSYSKPSLHSVKNSDDNHSKDKRELKYSGLVYGWQAMPRNDSILALETYNLFCEKLVYKYEQKQLQLLDVDHGQHFDPDEALSQLDNFVTAVEKFPKLMEYCELRACIGRTIRLHHEHMLCGVFQKIILNLFQNMNNLLSSYQSTIAENQFQPFDGNIERLNLILNVGTDGDHLTKFLKEQEKLIISNVNKDLVPLIYKVYMHYSSSVIKEESGTTDIKEKGSVDIDGSSILVSESNHVNSRDRSGSNASNTAQLKKIFVSILNAQIDKFLREYLPASISASLDLNLDIDNRRIDTVLDKLTVIDKLVRKIPRINSSVAHVLLARLCIDFDSSLIQKIYANCEKALVEADLNSGDISNHSENNNKNNRGLRITTGNNEQTDQSAIKSNTRRKASGYSNSQPVMGFNYLPYDEDSLKVQFYRIAELSLLDFVKSVGSDLSLLYKLMLPQSLELYNQPISSEDKLKGSYGKWLKNNSSKLKSFRLLELSVGTKLSESFNPNPKDDTLSETNVVSNNENKTRFNNQNLQNNENSQIFNDENSPNRFYSISTSAFVIRTWFKIIEGILLLLFEDTSLVYIIQSAKKFFLHSGTVSHQKYNANSNSSGGNINNQGLNGNDGTLPLSVIGATQHNKIQMQRSFTQTSKKSPVAIINMNRKNSAITHGEHQMTSTPSLTSNPMIKAISTSESILMQKINRLFVEKIDAYEQHLGEFSAGSILNSLSMVFVKNLIEIWRCSYIATYDNNSFGSVLVLNIRQLSCVQIDTAFLKLLMSSYSNSIQYTAQQQGSANKKGSPSLLSMQIRKNSGFYQSNDKKPTTIQNIKPMNNKSPISKNVSANRYGSHLSHTVLRTPVVIQGGLSPSVDLNEDEANKRLTKGSRHVGSVPGLNVQSMTPATGRSISTKTPGLEREYSFGRMNSLLHDRANTGGGMNGGFVSFDFSSDKSENPFYVLALELDIAIINRYKPNVSGDGISDEQNLTVADMEKVAQQAFTEFC
ncbi:hypothetical protein BB559_001629 [Furculomyces boomerangus]|uniref:Uncharacterized protein n=1 Tax=Furculomyces boomerangus TaxID=61424 RepID=A0A2T9Z1B3_9FUNG|nr:hypothetical protein BB559_001629 [Furculomyces boomerangus]